MFCNNCGNKVSDNANFCPKCGTKLQGRQSSSSPNTHYEFAQTNADQQSETSEQEDEEQHVTHQKAPEHKVKMYMKGWGVSSIITGILVLLIFRLKVYQITVTLLGIIPIDRPIWGVSLIILGIGLLAVGSTK